MFIASGPALVAAQCKAGLVGSFPALNARPAELLDTWLTQLQDELAQWQSEHPQRKVGPIAVNQIVHQSNDRLAQDVATCVKHQVPIIISSLRAPPKEMLDAVHSYGGIVLHDVISLRHAEKALEAGVDGLILVAAGAGGHAGTLALRAGGRSTQDVQGATGPVRLHRHGRCGAGGAGHGRGLRLHGLALAGHARINVDEAYRQAIVESTAADVVYTNLFTGVHGNYLKKSIVNAGLDPDNLPEADKTKMNFGSGGGSKAKAWRDIWGAGQGVGLMEDVPTVAEMVDRLEEEYRAARARLAVRRRFCSNG
jgi:nitronate monooxygenase